MAFPGRFIGSFTSQTTRAVVRSATTTGLRIIAAAAAIGQLAATAFLVDNNGRDAFAFPAPVLSPAPVTE
ncbi:hypothetical protein ACQ86N_15630 [Puia sp. P3]|uniref:hypothetical protein n=1 Tax=Puia sp. P3 TaxID=3423952 RepID=UPI003D66EFF1